MNTAENINICDKNTLYIVPTPIGNLSDISKRAIEVLNNVDLIAAEDTRHTGILLTNLGIKTKTFAFHDHNEQNKAEFVADKILNGQSIALVSDAGTPLISDPGYHLVNICTKKGIKVVPLPGPCAFVTALSASGLPSNTFSFEGFLPAKSASKNKILNELVDAERTLIFYESPHRILETLDCMLAAFGPNREAVIARELTKTFESFYHGTFVELIAKLNEHANHRKGEMVILVKGYIKDCEQEIDNDVIKTMQLLIKELPLKKAAAITSELSGVKKNLLYKWGLNNL